MASAKTIVVIGGGGHAKVIIDALRCGHEYDITGIIDNKLKPGSSVLGLRVLGGDALLRALHRKGTKYAFIGVGSVGDCSTRKRIYRTLKEIGFELPVVKHPKAVIARDVKLAEGAFVAARAVVNPGSVIGKNAIINTSASIDHDCIIGDFVHVAPGTTLSGGVRVGEGTHIGTGANIIQTVKIGKECMVGAGVTVRRNIRTRSSYIGDYAPEAGMRRKVFIIAEAGVNHNGDIEIAKKMIDAAKAAGAHAVKFQTFKAERMAVKDAPKAAYQKKFVPTEKSQFKMLKRLELTRKDYITLFHRCRKRGIMFMSSPFDVDSVKFLDKLGMRVFKVPSGELTNIPYLKKIGRLKKPVILSTGMSNLDEVKMALDILISAGAPKKKITVLQCNTQYPTKYKDVNLLAMLTMKAVLKVDVGYSDHTLGLEAPLAAAVLGASVIEKHFTLDKEMEGPDHKASLEPSEFREMAEKVKTAVSMLGKWHKEPSLSEMKNRDIIRKSIVARRYIKKGERFNEENIDCKRAGRGISPVFWERVLGVKAKRSFKKDEFITI